MKWAVRLTGNEVDKEMLLKTFDLEDFKITKNSDDYYIESKRFESITRPEDVLKIAREYINYAGGLL